MDTRIPSRVRIEVGQIILFISWFLIASDWIVCCSVCSALHSPLICLLLIMRVDIVVTERRYTCVNTAATTTVVDARLCPVVLLDRSAFRSQRVVKTIEQNPDRTLGRDAEKQVQIWRCRTICLKLHLSGYVKQPESVLKGFLFLNSETHFHKYNRSIALEVVYVISMRFRGRNFHFDCPTISNYSNLHSELSKIIF